MSVSRITIISLSWARVRFLSRRFLRPGPSCQEEELITLFVRQNHEEGGPHQVAAGRPHLQRVPYPQFHFPSVHRTTPPMQVNFEGLAQNSRSLYMFLEYVQGGELFTHLRDEGMF